MDTYDVVIIGSGISGLTAALNAKTDENKVLVISKNFPTHSQSCQAQGGINAVIYEDSTDSVKKHINDTYKASKNLANISNIELMCKTAKETLIWLDEIGVPFNRKDEGKFAQRKFGGTNEKRTCYSSDYTGLKIIHTLFDQCINKNIDFLNEHFLLDLIIKDEICSGVIVYDITNGLIKEINSKSTILASGGYASIYFNHTTNSHLNSSDALIIALKNGVKLSNLEFIQFHPTTLVNSNILISESARGEGGFLVDENEKRFIDELKSRDEISKAIYEKNLKGEKVFLDLRHLANKIDDLIPQERNLALNFANTNIKEELLEIKPASHYSMGGIQVDINCKTNIKNLYACGECAQANLHGANRLGGNSLLEVVTFGKIAGIEAKNNSSNSTLNESSYDIKKIDSYIKEIFTLPNNKNFYEYKNKLGDIMFKNVGIMREEKSLQEALNYINKTLDEIELMGIKDKSSLYNKNLIEFIEFTNMLEISKLVVTSALNRKESRGAHQRIDYPELDNFYQKNSIVYLKNDNYEYGFEEIL